MYYNLLLSLFLEDAVFILGECLMFRLQCPRKLSCYIKIKHVNSAKPYSNRVVECCLYRLFGRFIPGFFHVIYRKILLCVWWFIIYRSYDWDLSFRSLRHWLYQDQNYIRIISMSLCVCMCIIGVAG